MTCKDCVHYEVCLPNSEAYGFNRKLEFIASFEKWLVSEPPMILFWRWRRWKKCRPVFKALKEREKE